MAVLGPSGVYNVLRSRAALSAHAPSARIRTGNISMISMKALLLLRWFSAHVRAANASTLFFRVHDEITTFFLRHVLVRIIIVRMVF